MRLEASQLMKVNVQLEETTSVILQPGMILEAIGMVAVPQNSCAESMKATAQRTTTVILV